MYRIQIVGAGYVGTAMAEFFVREKQRVSALFKTASRCAELEALGVEPYCVDLTHPETLDRLPRADFIVLSPAPSERTEEGYRQIYLKGIGHYLQILGKHPRPRLLVYLSSTGVSRSGIRAQILQEAENQVLHCGFPSLVFRLSGIYGPDRNRVKALQEGRVETVQEEAYMNMIHRDDIVGAMTLLFKKGEEGRVYVGVDDEPVKRSVFYDWLSKKFETLARVTVRPSESPVGKRYSNADLKALGYSFRYPTFREGYGELFKKWRVSRSASDAS